MSTFPRATIGQKKGQLTRGNGKAGSAARGVPPYLKFPFLFHRTMRSFMQPNIEARQKSRAEGMADYLWKQQILKDAKK